MKDATPIISRSSMIFSEDWMPDRSETAAPVIGVGVVLGVVSVVNFPVC